MADQSSNQHFQYQVPQFQPIDFYSNKEELIQANQHDNIEIISNSKLEQLRQPVFTDSIDQSLDQQDQMPPQIHQDS